MKFRQKFLKSDFYCTQCGEKGIPIPRKGAHPREKGHLKKLYCIYCNKETNHVEINPKTNYTYENFLEEFNLGRFVDGQRKELIGCSNISCQYNKDEKCWNSNYSFNCKHRRRKINE